MNLSICFVQEFFNCGLQPRSRSILLSDALFSCSLFWIGNGFLPVDFLHDVEDRSGQAVLGLVEMGPTTVLVYPRVCCWMIVMLVELVLATAETDRMGRTHLSLTSTSVHSSGSNVADESLVLLDSHRVKESEAGQSMGNV